MKIINNSICFFLGIALLAGCTQVNPSVPDNLNDKNIVTTSTKKAEATDLIENYLKKIARENDELKDTPPQSILGTKKESLPKIKDTKKLTYFTFEALDNNLYGDLNRVINTLESTGSNKNSNILAQTDNWKENNTARYFITDDKDSDNINSEFLQLGTDEENSGDPKVFSDAVHWAFSNYPAKMKWLNMSTHGLGFAGIGYDDNPENNMNIIQFAQAVKSAIKHQKLDIKIFDACLMATVEVASELQDISDTLIGSEDSTYYWGNGYNKTFSKLEKKPDMTVEQIAKSLVLDVNEKGNSQQTLTISATNLTKIDLLEKEIDKLAIALQEALPKHREDIFRAFKESKPFAQADDIPFRDINRLVSLLKDNVENDKILTICDKINQILYQKGVILLSRQSKMEKDQGRGLSIYVPMGGKVSAVYRQTHFAKNTHWDEFLSAFNATIKPAS